MENVDIEKLIKEIHVRPTIWDMRSDDYFNKIKTKQSWDDITDAFVEGIVTQEERKHLGSILQKKWKNIRDRYSKNVKQNKRKSGQAGRKNVYKYTNQLAFLSDVIHLRFADISMNNIDPPSPKKRNSLEKALLGAIGKHNVRQNQNTQKDCYADDDKFFLLSLLPFLKSIPPHFKFAVRMDIMQSINKFNVIPPLASQLASTVQQQGPITSLRSSIDEVKPYVGQSSSVHHREPQPGPTGTGAHQQSHATSLLSPINSIYLQDDSESSSSCF
uniref:Uncharacterized protein LOC114324624 n=1 Tax=Diabrotica virgifera virgifera TaxID=50390 RepID=A0A6P7EYI0_DIAVI